MLSCLFVTVLAYVNRTFRAIANTVLESVTYDAKCLGTSDRYVWRTWFAGWCYITTGYDFVSLDM